MESLMKAIWPSNLGNDTGKLLVAALFAVKTFA
jgi:hypothetical protein